MKLFGPSNNGSGPNSLVDAETLKNRREAVFLLLAGTFLAAMCLLNVVGITRFIQLGPLALAVGVLPYPLTFLCTDLIGELYGRKRAAMVVWVGLFLNFFIIGVLWLGQALPAVALETQPPWQVLKLAEGVMLPTGDVVEQQIDLFYLVYACTAGAVFASMIAYMTAQFCDVYLFHFWKRLTRGRHLWLRNNGSTVVSQLVDSVMVVAITFGASFFSGKMAFKALLLLVASNYAFKLLSALVDTVPFYIGVRYLSRYLQIDPMAEFAKQEPAAMGTDTQGK